MSEQTFEQMLEASLKTIHNGEVVEGTVIDVKPDEIILNIGYKSDGIITRNEYSNTANLDLTTCVNVGDTMEAKVLKVNDGDGQVLLTYKRLAADKGNKRLEEAFNNKEVLKATVAQILDGGLSVVVEESRVFIPASLVSDSYEKDLSKYLGQEIEFVITEFNPRRRRIIGDRKQLLMAERMKKIEKALPGVNCSACGAPSCAALAEDIVRGDADISSCMFINRHSQASEDAIRNIWGDRIKTRTINQDKTE